MKKTGWALFTATLIYSYIFYRQNAGINFLLFSVIVVALLAWERPMATRERRWQVAALLTLLSGTFVFLHSSVLAVAGNCLSLLSVAGASMNRNSSTAINLISSGASILASPAFLAEDIYNRARQPKDNEKKYLVGMIVWIVPAALAVLFFALYRAANPLFAEFTKAINLDFLTFGWLMFTLGGLLICSGLVRSRRFEKIDEWESAQKMPDHIQAASSWDERKAATILFLLLNGMLLFMNLLDVKYLYLGSGLPQGITHKQFVHNGVGNMIISIVLGITVILYFFRGELNFRQNGLIRLLVYAWIIQNVFMVISTSVRNEIYISEALITYKRIGVFFWLAFAAAGLATTAYKVHARMHAWFLVRSNGLFFLVILVLSSAVDWDRFVTDFNLNRIGNIKDLDKRYLISLSETNLGRLYNIAGKEGFEHNIYYHYESDQNYSNKEKLDAKLADHLLSVHGTDWRSFSLRARRVMRDIDAADAQGRITTLNLSHTEIKDLDAFIRLQNFRKLVLPADFPLNKKTASEIAAFPRLDSLVIPALKYTDLLHLIGLRNLRSVHIGELDKTALAFLRHKMPGTVFTVEQFVYSKTNNVSAGR